MMCILKGIKLYYIMMFSVLKTLRFLVLITLSYIKVEISYLILFKPYSQPIKIILINNLINYILYLKIKLKIYFK